MKIILIGIQGSGKSTQGNLLSEKLQIPYLSSGHIFRELAKEKSPLGRYVKETINSGYLISDEKKGPFLRELINKHEMNQVLVFASSSQKADKICDKLVKNGFDAKAIHGKKSQGARTSALKDFKDGKLRVLVTSDLLSRGIDIEFLPFVINYELPRSPKEFIHRIGRTGRANAVGEAITFVTEEDKHHFQVIQKKMGTWLTLIPV